MRLFHSNAYLNSLETLTKAHDSQLQRLFLQRNEQQITQRITADNLLSACEGRSIFLPLRRIRACNLLDDLKIDVRPTELLNTMYDDIYDKLFIGNNLPVFTPPGCEYHPEWSPEELKLIREALSSALLKFRSRLEHVGAVN